MCVEYMFKRREINSKKYSTSRKSSKWRDLQLERKTCKKNCKLEGFASFVWFHKV